MNPDYVPLIFPGVGLVLLVIASVSLVMTRRFVREALRTQGTVVGFVQRRSGKGGRTYSPVVTFATQTGQHQFTDPVSSSPAGYTVGDRVEVLYHWQDHGRARLASPFRLYFVPGLLGLLGLIFTSVGVVVFFALSASRLR
jgi:hypothetical protein